MGKGDHFETLLLLALFYQSTPSCLKVMGGVCAGNHVQAAMWCGGGPCDFSVTPWSISFFFLFLVVLLLGVCWDRGLDSDFYQGLTIFRNMTKN